MLELYDIAFAMPFIMMAAILWRGIAAREQAVAEVKRYLHTQDLQLLDDTVAWRGYRREQGAFVRLYEFEFTSTAEERYAGSIAYSARRPSAITLAPYRMQRPPHEPLH
jgi:chromosomal replication initiation ATPase DnaA